MSELIRENAEQWQTALATVFPKGIPRTAAWQDPRAVAQTLNCFCGVGLNYTMLPVSGGMNILEVRIGHQPRCVELIHDPRGAYVCKVGNLVFEHFPDAPWESFLLLETAPLEPSGIYPLNGAAYEEVVELPGGKLVDRRCWDQGTFGFDEHGQEKPLPDDARRVMRYFRGKFLMVGQFSWWNSVSNHDNGRQDQLSATEIRAAIQDHLSRKRV